MKKTLRYLILMTGIVCALCGIALLVSWTRTGESLGWATALLVSAAWNIIDYFRSRNYIDDHNS